MSDTANILNRQAPEHLKGVFRPALLKDAKAIHKLTTTFADKGLMLPRSLSEIYETIRQYTLYEQDGKVIAACGLHITWEDLAEIRALSVAADSSGRGIGSELVRLALKEARRLGAVRVFALTYVPGFFEKLGFAIEEKHDLPHKIWGDCVRCHKFPDCDETALMIDV